MKIRRKALAAALEPLDERQVRVIVSTDQVDRVGDIVDQKGIDLGAFRLTKTVLWNHDQNKPIAACRSIELAGEQLVALVQFPPEGTAKLADEIYGLIKAEVINATSIGFLPVLETPIVAGQPKKGVRVEKSQLLEFSFVSVPANPGALITSRSFGKGSMRLTVKGLYDVGQLAYLLSALNSAVLDAEWEKDYEGDDSDVPAMLLDGLQRLGKALVAMTAEEVGEMLARHDVDDTDVVIETRAAPFARLVRRSLDHARTKAGRTFSQANADEVRKHCGTVKDAAEAMLKMVDEAEPAAADDGTAEKRLTAERREARLKDVRDLALGRKLA